MHAQLMPNLYRIEIPLPQSPLKSLNSYVIKGLDRSLIIDTGMNREECLGPMMTGLEALEVDLDRTDLFITHLHADHIGQVGKLSRNSSRVFFSQVETAVIAKETDQAEARFDEFFRFYVENGFPEKELRRAFANHPGYKYSPKRRIEFTTLKEGDVLEAGGFSFHCIETPGHSPGHMCLYEPNRKILISGDHILFDITPNITCWPELENALGSYLESLNKVKDLDVALVLPGHRNSLNNHRKRITELEEHHRTRLTEVVAALEGGPRTAWEIAPFIKWDINVRTWEEFPTVQKWFALGETLAHIRHLQARGTVGQNQESGRTLYSLA